MKPEERTALTVELLGARTQDDVLACLSRSGLPDKEQLSLLAELLVLTQQDKDRLKERIAHLLAARFGRSSEKASAEQLVLFALAAKVSPTIAFPGPTTTDTPASEPAAAAAAGENNSTALEEVPLHTKLAALAEQTERDIKALIEAKRAAAQEERERRKQARQAARAAGGTANDTPWPNNLPVEETYIYVENKACSDPDCGRQRGTLRFETSWYIEEQTSYKVVVTHREVVACGHHHGAPESAPLPPATIVPKGHLGLALSGRILWLRFSQNLSICRIVEIFAADGIDVSEEMIHTLFHHAYQLLTPVLRALLAEVRLAQLINLDDTPVRILDRTRPKRQRLGRIWLALGDELWAYYFATASWEAGEAEKELGDVAGVVQGDGYRGHKKNSHRLGWVLAGCMAHLRRKLMRAVVARDPRATEAMKYIQALYRIERLAKLGGLNPAQRLQLRQERSVPLMRALADWASRVAPTIEEGSPLGQAWTYLKNQWETLLVFLSNGHVSIDNNAAERGLRRITIGRKLWLFFRGDHTCKRAAAIASILMTARLHGANELAYLKWLFRQLLRREWSEEAARKLLPDYWLRAQQEEVKEREAVGRRVA